MSNEPRVFQVHAVRDGSVITMSQRAYPESDSTITLRELVEEAANDVREYAAAHCGGSYEIVVHGWDSDGLLVTREA